MTIVYCHSPCLFTSQHFVLTQLTFTGRTSGHYPVTYSTGNVSDRPPPPIIKIVFLQFTLLAFFLLSLFLSSPLSRCLKEVSPTFLACPQPVLTDRNPPPPTLTNEQQHSMMKHSIMNNICWRTDRQIVICNITDWCTVYWYQLQHDWSVYCDLVSVATWLISVLWFGISCNMTDQCTVIWYQLQHNC